MADTEAPDAEKQRVMRSLETNMFRFRFEHAPMQPWLACKEGYSSLTKAMLVPTPAELERTSERPQCKESGTAPI